MFRPNMHINWFFSIYVRNLNSKCIKDENSVLLVEYRKKFAIELEQEYSNKVLSDFI